jgi:hypothetical protein
MSKGVQISDLPHWKAIIQKPKYALWLRSTLFLMRDCRMLRLKIGLRALSERRPGHYERSSFNYEKGILRIVML